MVCRNLHLAHIRMWAGDYTLSGLVGFELRSKTVGVLGTGAIGAAACRIFKVRPANMRLNSPRPDLSSGQRSAACGSGVGCLVRFFGAPKNLTADVQKNPFSVGLHLLWRSICIPQ